MIIFIVINWRAERERGKRGMQDYQHLQKLKQCASSHNTLPDKMECMRTIIHNLMATRITPAPCTSPTSKHSLRTNTGAAVSATAADSSNFFMCMYRI
jgi:hypothetical protein